MATLRLYDTCYHGIIFSKVNFRVPLPSSFYGEIWDYKNASNEAIQRSIQLLTIKNFPK